MDVKQYRQAPAEPGNGISPLDYLVSVTPKDNGNEAMRVYEVKAAGDLKGRTQPAFVVDNKTMAAASALTRRLKENGIDAHIQHEINGKTDCFIYVPSGQDEAAQYLIAEALEKARRAQEQAAAQGSGRRLN